MFAVTPKTLDDKVILKHTLFDERKGQPRDWREVRIPSDERRSDRFSFAYKRMLERQFGEHGFHIWHALNETIINYREHAHHYDPNKNVIVRSWRDDNRMYFTIGGFGEPFDPRKVWLTQEERNKYRGDYQRGNGFMIITGFASDVMCDDDGKSMMLIFDLKKAA